jgi:hypothetical protein
MAHGTKTRRDSAKTAPGSRRRSRAATEAFACSVVVHALLLAGSTAIYMQGIDDLGREAAKLFNVQVRETPPKPRPVKPPPQPDPDTIKTIEEILRQETLIEPPSLPMPGNLDSSMTERMREVGQLDYMPREDAADVSSETAAAVDLKVVAMANDAFAENIGPRRRAVSEGGGVIVPPGSLPVWSSATATETQVADDRAVGRAQQRTDAVEKQAEQATRDIVDEEQSLPTGKLARGERNVPDISLPLNLLPVLEETETVRKYPSLDDLLDVKLRVYHVANDPLGYFEVRISARDKGRLAVLPKDIVFVIDSSKSTGSSKLNEAQSAVRTCLRELNPYDTFNIVAFKREPDFFSDTLVAATPENVESAERFVRGLLSGGETDVYSALLPLVQRPARPNVPYILFLFSDGKSTVGTLGSREIINQLTESNRTGAKASIYAFAGGSSVNQYLLDLLALRNKGASETTRVVNRIDEEMPSFYRRVRDPLLTDLSSNFSGIEKDEIFPRRMPDFYLGRDVTVLGRFADEKEFSMRITGLVGGVRKELVFRREFEEAVRGDEDIVLRWATRKAYYVIEQMCALGHTPELAGLLELINKRYGVRTAYDPQVVQ